VIEGKPTRRLWIAALVVSVTCLAGLGYALVTDWNTEPARQLEPAQRQATGGSGFTLGLVIGIGAGIVLGSIIALRKRGS
jgi:hypothetical protein